MTLTLLHLRDTPNIGDRWCSPFDWFDWPMGTTVRDLRKPGEDYDVGIYGGGKIFGELGPSPGISRKPGNIHIAWGVSTLQKWPISLKYSRSRGLCDLVGSRDRGDKRYLYAPCSSCMAPHFDNPPAPIHETVFYYHAWKTDRQGIALRDEIPVWANNSGSLDEALSFIASGHTVVSNSYHGVYWALLMGRRVVCLPFSNKFSQYHLPPYYSTAEAWFTDRYKGLAWPEMLSECRASTKSFKARVEELIWSRS